MVYVFALVGMVCWGISPLFAKMGLRDINPLVGLSIRTFFTASIVFGWMFASGNVSQLQGISSRAVILLVAEAILATVIGDLAYFSALKQGSASVVMLIMACSPAITILFSILFFHERLTATTLIGGFLVVIGLILVV